MATGRYRITAEPDVYAARRGAERLAASEGFPRIAAQEIALIASELAWNVLRHAGGGELEIRLHSDPQAGPAIVLVATDSAPPIADLQLAMIDGNSAAGPIPLDERLRRRGLGSGLGAVARLSDRLVQEPLAKGKRIVATRFLARPRPGAPG